MVERRDSPRHKSFLKGTVYFNNRRSSIDCMIRDFSASGARLHFSAAITTPDVVDLYIPNKDQTFHAKVRWRKLDEMGVTFIDAQTSSDKAPTPPLDLSQRVAQLEMEVAKLHRTIVELKLEFRKQRDD